MKSNTRKSAAIAIILLIAIFGCMILANQIQCDFGKVEVSTSAFQTDKGEITYKLYKPKGVSAETPAPAVLLLHGYQNDKETCAAYAMELSRRGYVVMAIDEYGHGSNSISMINRGYTTHKVTVNYGEDSEEAGTYVQIGTGGQTRYKIMMNFSNLSFFKDRYSKDDYGNSVADSSMGGAAAYACLAAMDFVDETKMAISGHSMGTWASWSTAAAYSDAKNADGVDITPKATVLQCGELFSKAAYDADKIHFNNVLLLNAKYDEFNYFRDYKNIVSDELLSTPLRMEFMGVDAPFAWNTTYGDFADGSARRIELLMTNHRLTTHNAHGMTTAIDWLDAATGHKSSIASSEHIFLAKEYLVFASMLMALGMLMPLADVLMATPFFSSVKVGIPDRPYRIKSGSKWWKGAIVTMLTAACTYPFMTQLGHGLLPLPEGVFRMTIGNGFLSWYLLLIIVMLLTTIIPFKKSKKTDKPMDYWDLGLAGEMTAAKLDWALMGKSALLVLVLLGAMYAILAICEACFKLDFRFIWPFFKTFSLTRFGQFLVYIPVFALFFLLNNSKIFAGARQEESSKPGFKSFMRCWWKYALLMVGGVLIIVLLEYIPFFMDIGPGADLLFSPTFGGPFMSLLIVFAPQVLVFSVLCTYMYRKTGSVYVGAFTVASLACWIVTGGSAML